MCVWYSTLYTAFSAHNRLECVVWECVNGGPLCHLRGMQPCIDAISKWKVSIGNLAALLTREWQVPLVFSQAAFIDTLLWLGCAIWCRQMSWFKGAYHSCVCSICSVCRRLFWLTVTCDWAWKERLSTQQLLYIFDMTGCVHVCLHVHGMLWASLVSISEGVRSHFAHFRRLQELVPCLLLTTYVALAITTALLAFCNYKVMYFQPLWDTILGLYQQTSWSVLLLFHS